MTRCIIGFIFLVSPVLAQGQEDQEKEKIAKLIRDLVDKDPEVWKKAKENLKNLGKQAIPYLRDALKSKDTNIKGRVEEIIEDIYGNLVEKALRRFERRCRWKLKFQPIEVGFREDVRSYISNCRFYADRIISLFPSKRIILGINEKGEIFTVNHLNDLKHYLKPAKTKEDVINVAIIVARLVVWCRFCDDIPVLEDDCDVEKTEGGGFEVSIQFKDWRVRRLLRGKCTIKFTKKGEVKILSKHLPHRHR